MALPVIEPGVDGAVLIVTAIVCALEVAQEFDAITLTLPEVEPNVTVAEVVP